MATDVLAATHENDHLSQTEIEGRINKWGRILAVYDCRKNARDEIQQTLDC